MQEGSHFASQQQLVTHNTGGNIKLPLHLHPHQQKTKTNIRQGIPPTHMASLPFLTHIHTHIDKSTHILPVIW